MIPPFRRGGKTNTSRDIKGWRTRPLPLPRSRFSVGCDGKGGESTQKFTRRGNEERARNQRPGTTEARGQTRSETRSVGETVYSKSERQERRKRRKCDRGKTEKEKKKSLLLAWLSVFLFGLFGGLLLIKLLLHDAPS